MWKDRSWAEAALAWFRGFRVGARSPGPGLTAGEQSASCAPGNPVETVKAKVKPKVPPAPAFLVLGSRARFSARTRPVLAPKGTGTLVAKISSAIVWPTRQWVRAPSLTPSSPELPLLALLGSRAIFVAVLAGGRLVTPAQEWTTGCWPAAGAGSQFPLSSQSLWVKVGLLPGGVASRPYGLATGSEDALAPARIRVLLQVAHRRRALGHRCPSAFPA